MNTKEYNEISSGLICPKCGADNHNSLENIELYFVNELDEEVHYTYVNEHYMSTSHVHMCNCSECGFENEREDFCTIATKQVKEYFSFDLFKTLEILNPNK